MLSLVLLFVISNKVDLPIKVDKVEINAVYGHDDCKYKFTQIILWRWSSQLKRYEVAQWYIPKSDWSYYNKIVKWKDREGNLYRVRAVSLIETKTLCDPEIMDRSKCPAESRLPYFQPIEQQ